MIELNLNQIIGTIQVHQNGNVWMIPREKGCDILSDYLNSVNKLPQYNEQKTFLTELKAVISLTTTEQKFGLFEEKLGGMEWGEDKNWETDKKFGWVSLINYQPNLLLDIETNELFLAYSIDDKIQITFKNLETLMKDWMNIIELCGSSNPVKMDDFELKKEVTRMALNLNKYKL